MGFALDWEFREQDDYIIGHLHESYQEGAKNNVRLSL